MANVNLNPVRSREIEVIPLPITIAVASNVPSANTIAVASVAKTATGTFEITLAEAWVKLLSAQATLEVSSPADVDIQIKSADVVSTKKVVVVLSTEGAAVDVATCKLHIVLYVKNSSV